MALVKQLQYAVLGALVLVVAVGGAVALFVPRDHASTAGALDKGQILAASASVVPQSHLFGAPVHVRIDAVLDRRQLDPRRVQLESNWIPYQETSPMTRTRVDVGSFTRLRWETDLRCIVVDCVPNPGSAMRAALKPSTIRYLGRAQNGTTPAPVKIKWPQLSGFSRLDPIDLERGAIVSSRGQNLQINAILPPWRVTSIPIGAVSYRISPTTLFWTALAAALALVGAAAALLRPWLPSLGLRSRQPPRTRLEYALDVVDRARGGQAVEERKALELLAGELRRGGWGKQAWAASELAWSLPDPEPSRTRALTAVIRRDLERRTNGHRA